MRWDGRALPAALRAAMRGRRGSAQLGLLVAATAVVGGMTVGNGIASHSAKSGYDLAWLADGKRGQVVQVDPVLGRSNVRLQVAPAGDRLEVVQGDGHLVVIDRKTGKISSIDLGTLLLGGARAETPGDAVKVLLAGSRMYVANLPRGTLQAVDPATQASVGVPWTAGRPLVDVGIDGRHDVWALDTASRLTTLRWAASRGTLAPVATRSVPGAGPGSVIVGHDAGVTVVGSRGAILRTGTGSDTTLNAPQVSGPLAGPQSSPDDLVPVAVPGQSSVVIVGGSGAVVDDVAALGCPHPGAPTAFDGKVYVPCTGSHRVIVLDDAGRPSGPPIPTPAGGDPQLTVSGGRLVIDVPGSGTATVVDGSGSTHDFPTVDPGVGVQNPSTPPPPPPPPPAPDPSPRHDHGNHGGGHHGGSGNHGDVPSGGHGSEPTGAASESPPAGASGSPGAGSGGASVTASARPDGTVLVSWTGADARAGFTVTLADTGAQVAQVPAGATSATVTVLDPGTTAAFVVHAFRSAGREQWRATSAPVTVLAAPGAASGVTYSVRSHRNGTARLGVTWTAAAANGGAVSYTVTATGATGSTSTTATTADLDVACASSCSGTISVTATNAAGTASAAQVAFTVAGTPATPPPAAPPPVDPTTTSNPPPPPPPPTSAPAPPPPPALPAGGQSVLAVSDYYPGSTDDGPATVTLAITLPGDYQSFGGSCELQDNGAAAGSVNCTQASSTQTLEYTATGTHSYTVVASNSSGSVTSAAVTQRVVYRRITCINSLNVRSLTGGSAVHALPPCNPCGTSQPSCQIPFVALPPVTAPAEPATRPTIARGSGLRWAL